MAAMLGGVLQRASFTERSLCEALKLPTLDAVDTPVFKTLSDHVSGLGLLEVLSRVFVFGEIVDRKMARQFLSEEEIAAFLETDLFRVWKPGESGDERLYCPVRVVPVEIGDAARDVIVVGDRGDHPDGSVFEPFEDIVFSGHNPLTRQFLKLLPLHHSGAILDLCGGTGIAALAMASPSTQCTSADIAERSTHFAQFNAWLNGCEQFDVACGDLYQPLGERQFDCILAHPPYVPALSHKFIYRDGGESGDAIVRGVVEGVPDHVRVGGTFQLLCLGMDTAEGPFEQRVRHWLGPRERDFDIVFALDSINPPELIATRLIDRSGGTTKDLMRWRELFARLQVQGFVYGAIVGRRFGDGSAGGAETRRVLLTKETKADAFDWLFTWFDWLRQPGGPSRVLDLKPVLPSDLRLDVQHRVENGAFAPATYHFENGGKPFKSRLATEPWVAALVSELDGTKTVRDVFHSAVARERVPTTFSETDLERLMCFLIERGCVSAEIVGAAEHVHNA
jgi:methylase of polypeptide subunit release factors